MVRCFALYVAVGSHQSIAAGVNTLLQRSEDAAQEVAAMDAVLAVLLSELPEHAMECATSAAPDVCAIGPQAPAKKTATRGPLQPVGNAVSALPSPAQPSLALQVRTSSPYGPSLQRCCIQHAPVKAGCRRRSGSSRLRRRT